MLHHATPTPLRNLKKPDEVRMGGRTEPTAHPRFVPTHPAAVKEADRVSHADQAGAGSELVET
jgi:hypothetical protein